MTYYYVLVACIDCSAGAVWGLEWARPIRLLGLVPRWSCLKAADAGPGRIGMEGWGSTNIMRTVTMITQLHHLHY